MELIYRTEKSEKETIRLFLRRRGFLRDLRQCAAIMSVLWLAVSIFYWFGSAGSSCGLCQGVVYALLGTAVFLLCFFLLDRMLVQAPRRAYRQRVSHKIEYRLTDDALAFTVGETQFSSPWNNVAKKFRIDRKAIYLYGNNLPLEAQCIPGWRGHGVAKKELVSMLKKAGLKKKMNGWLKFLVGLAVTFILITCYFYIGGIEWGDWTIPNEAELRLEKRDVPDEDNAYLALMALTNLYHVAEGDDESGEISDKTFVRLYGNPFFRDGDNDEREKWTAARNDPASPGRAEKLLAGNAKFFDGFHAALLRRDFKAPETIIPGRCPAVSNLPELKPVIEFARLVCLKAQIELEKSDVNGAIKDVRDIHSLGQILSAKTDARSSGLVQFLVGELLKEIAYGKTCDFIVMGKASDEMLDVFSKMVDEDDAVAPANRARALKAEWDMHFRFIDWFCDVVHKSSTYDECIQTIYEGFDERECPRPWKVFDLELRMLWYWPGIRSFALNRREMKFQAAEMLRAAIAKKDLDKELDRIIPSRGGWCWVFLPNGLGNVLQASQTPCFEGLFIKGDLARIRIRLILVAEKWRRAHGGKTPPTLDALVPDYLAAVPKDPWDKAGGPIKYDAASGVAWSVGKDGKYDYRKVGEKGRADDYKTSYLAFRLDGKPIGFASQHNR